MAVIGYCLALPVHICKSAIVVETRLGIQKFVIFPTTSSNSSLGDSWATCFYFRMKRPEIFIFNKISDSMLQD